MNAFARSPAARLVAVLLLAPLTVHAVPTLIVDGDGDGVSDERDECPYSPAGESVNADGCSVDGDADNDGVLDLADLCPYSDAGSKVDAEGCSLDDDFDGIANGRDLCPDTALGERVDIQGCDPTAPGKGRTAIAAAPAAVKPAAALRPRATTTAAKAIPVAIRRATPIPVPIARPLPIPAATQPGRIEMPADADVDVQAEALLAKAEAPAVAIPSNAPPVKLGEAAAATPAIAVPIDTGGEPVAAVRSTPMRALPSAPRIVLSAADVLALQQHPSSRSADFSPQPAVAIESARAPAPVPVPASVPAPVAEPSVASSIAHEQPQTRRRPNVPQISLSVDAMRAVQESAPSPANAVRIR